MINGKTKASIISAICACLICAGVVAGWYSGWTQKIGREVLRENRIDQHLTDSVVGYMRLTAVEKQAATTQNKVDNLDANVRTLIESQERTNAQLLKLNNTLMDYMARQSR